MNYRLFLTVLIVLAAIATISICINKPQMHKSVLVYNSEFRIEPQNSVEIEVNNIPTIEQNNTNSPKTVKIINFDDFDNNYSTEKQTTTVNNNVVGQNIAITTQSTIPKVTNITTQTQGIKTTKPIVNVQTNKTQPVTNQQSQTVKISTPQLEANTPQIDIQKILDNNKKIQAEKQTNQTKTITSQPTKTTTSTTPSKTTIPTTTTSTPKNTTVPNTTTKTTAPTVQKAAPAPKVLTPQEEEIAWQVWRSNLQNKIMQDVKLPVVPQGTIFKFSFDVDKYGKITNIHTTASNTTYTPYAIQHIMPVIRSYQGRAILNFPQGSQRVTTTFVGYFKISTTNKYTTPQDYSDVERIVK